MNKRALLVSGLTLLTLAGCSGNWGVTYSAALETEVSSEWPLGRVSVTVPDTLTVSEDNVYAPDADIVWHGEDFGDRHEQVRAILAEGLTQGASELSGKRRIALSARLVQFHAVTPIAVARAPSAVHNIKFDLQVFDARTGEPLTEPQRISADLDAKVGSAAVVAAVQGDTQRVRIVRHLAAVIAGWLGTGEDQRRTFSSLGR